MNKILFMLSIICTCVNGFTQDKSFGKFTNPIDSLNEIDIYTDKPSEAVEEINTILDVAKLDKDYKIPVSYTHLTLPTTPYV